MKIFTKKEKTNELLKELTRVVEVSNRIKKKNFQKLFIINSVEATEDTEDTYLKSTELNVENRAEIVFNRINGDIIFANVNKQQSNEGVL